MNVLTTGTSSLSLYMHVFDRYADRLLRLIAKKYCPWHAVLDRFSATELKNMLDSSILHKI